MNEVKAVVRRKWGNRDIDTFVRINKEHSGGVEISMSMIDFAHAIKQEIGSITFTLTKAQFSEKLDNAINAVIRSMKVSTKGNLSQHVPYDK